MVIPVGTGVLKVNNPNLLSESGGNVIMADMWARGVLKYMDSVAKGAMGKVEPSKDLLAEKKDVYLKSCL